MRFPQGWLPTLLFLAVALPATVDKDQRREQERDPAFWNSKAKDALQAALGLQPRAYRAKNIILFLGDGMGVSTVSAARILRGQMGGADGEETQLTMDTFPYLALSKTYSVDKQVADSASTATAYHCGVKANGKTDIPMQSRVFSHVDQGPQSEGRWSSWKAEEYHMPTPRTHEEQLEWVGAAGEAGLWEQCLGRREAREDEEGPQPQLASVAAAISRSWYSDADLPSSARRQGCRDIATQLISNTDIDVILGGGRMYMTPKGTPDPEYPTSSSRRGDRKDKKNLIHLWLKNRKVLHLMYPGLITFRPWQNAEYVWHKEQFDAVNVKTTDHLMGLFEPKDMRFEIFRNSTRDPSIIEMTEKAIRILSKNPNGFFLFVEDNLCERVCNWLCLCAPSGRIDHGHHDGIAKLALTETVMFDSAVYRASQLTRESDTLTIITADHSHVFTFGGNTPRGNPIFGLAPKKADDKMPFTSILYANGPGYMHVNGTRGNVSAVDYLDEEYMQQAAVPLDSETHGGEDVAIYAKGPMAHLFHGVQEQSYIAHVMAYAACLEPYTDCLLPPAPPTSVSATPFLSVQLLPLVALLWVLST
ncbi:hypothetical protein JZ751_010071 [Albula glossodonta]|uniref:Alkaline phosphatase n=1 Tax=Albula glossodonta TaxID=121402 RepID=A0A8T2N307_9TELE|nr:hypothetical protein JZ751_010071 [Albula glossodonta]